MQEVSERQEVKRWSAQSEAALQDVLNDVGWDIFRSSSTDISEFADIAVSFVDILVE